MKRVVWISAGVAVFIAVAVGVYVGWNGWGGDDANYDGATAMVRRGELVVTINESGEIEAERRTVIRNEVPYSAIITYVVEEGTVVRKGDKIIAFECKELTDATEKQHLTVTDARNEYTQASENLALKKREMDNAVRKAEQAVEDAKIDLERYEKGEAPNNIRDARSKIQLAERDLKLAQSNLQFKLEVNKDPELNSPYSASEIEADRLSVERLELARQKAVADLQMLETYDHPREMRRLRMAVEDAEIDLERRELERKRELVKAEATEQAKLYTLRAQEEKLKELEEYEKKLVILAEEEGLVVYDTGGSRYRPSNVTVAVGERIEPRQQLMIIPEMSTLRVKTKVYEAMIQYVHPGLKAFVRLDAQPGEVLSGEVTKVAVLPNSQNRWLNPDVKIFDVTVRMDNPPPGLKPGMTAEVELVVARLPDVLKVPVAAVFTQQERTYCYRLQNGKAQQVDVRIGCMNDREVEIVAGLSEGDEVLLVPPPGQTVAPAGAEPEAEPGTDTALPAAEASVRNGLAAPAAADSGAARGGEGRSAQRPRRSDAQKSPTP